MHGEKRKHDTGAASESSSDKKAKKSWQMDAADALSPFSVGIFITCVRGKESAAMKDALELFNDYADRHNLGMASAEDPDQETVAADIEDAVAKELAQLQTKPASSSHDKARFTALKTGTECVLFIKTSKSIDPVELVHGICSEAHDSRQKKGGRFLRRLTPITASADASLPGLQRCLDKVLPHEFDGPAKSYKIEPNFRSHNALNRDMIIPDIASAITKFGPHTANMKDYDVLVMVEVLRGFLGVSIVRDWEKLRKYNLSEIYTSSMKAIDHAVEREAQSQAEHQK